MITVRNSEQDTKTMKIESVLINSIRKADLFIIGQSRYDNPYSSPAYCLAKEFARHNRVFYFDHPFSLKDYIKELKNEDKLKQRNKALLRGKNIYRKIEGTPENLTIVTPRLTLPINWLAEGPLYEFFSRINDRIITKALRKTILDFKVKDYIFINSFDPYFFRSFPNDISPKLLVYQTIDDISQEKYISRHGVKLEKEAAVKADFCLATSSQLTQIISRYNKRSFCIPNAADFSLFQKAYREKLPRPKEIENTDRKIICYTGMIGTRINYPLLKKIAIAHSDKILLMVGPADSEGYKAVGLDEFPNVVFAGGKNIEQLPAYLQHSDCCIIPFEYSTLTKSIYPLKINEYLTAGKPVVATAFSEDIKEFKHVAYISETEEKFVQNIELAIAENNEERILARIEEAKNNSWEARVKKFWDIVEGLNKKNSEFNK